VYEEATKSKCRLLDEAQTCTFFDGFRKGALQLKQTMHNK